MTNFLITKAASFNTLQGTRWRSTALLCLLLPSLAWSEAADGLNVFSDGEVIYAEQINENFRYVLENGGCSVNQVEGGALISCGDGSSAFIGSVANETRYPTASLPAADLSGVVTGDLVVIDSDGVIMGESAYGNPFSIWLPLSPIGPKALLDLQEAGNSVVAQTSSRGARVYFSEPNCTGQAFLDEYPLIAAFGESLVASPRERLVSVNVKSRYSAETGGCSARDLLIPDLYPATILSLPTEIQNAKPPLSIILAESSLAN